MIGAWTANRVGVRLSPSSFLYGVDDGNKLATFGFVVRALDALGVGYLCLLEPNAKDAARGVQILNVAETFRPIPRSRSSSTPASTRPMKSSRRETPTWWRSACPSSPTPTWLSACAAMRRSTSPIPTFYDIGPKGYTDYPMLADAVAA